MKVLITGGLGYIGTHLVQFLSNQPGWKVKILARRIPPEFESWKEKHEIIAADITKAEEINQCCDGCDAVIHLAALDKEESRQDPAQALMVSGIGTKNILEQAVRSKVQRFLYFSTIHVYGIPERERIDENTLVRPLSDYGISHFAGELYCQLFNKLSGLNTIRVRFSNGFGAPVNRNINCWSIVVHDFCLSASEKGKIVLKSEGTQKRDFIPMPDILQAVRLLLEAEDEKIKHDLYNVGSGQSFSILEIAHLIRDVYEELYGRTLSIEFAPDIIPADFKMPFYLDIERIKHLGFSPGGPEAVKEEIRRIFAFLENN